jgi:hypothetical protein
MDGECSTNVGNAKFIQDFSRKMIMEEKPWEIKGQMG